jgi:hypothetical protein
MKKGFAFCSKSYLWAANVLGSFLPNHPSSTKHGYLASGRARRSVSLSLIIMASEGHTSQLGMHSTKPLSAVRSALCADKGMLSLKEITGRFW